MRTKFLVIFAFFLFSNIYAENTVKSSSEKFLKNAFSLNEFTTLDEKTSNLTSTDSKDLIKLIGYRFSRDSVYYKKIMLILEKSNFQTSLFTLPKSVEAGYSPEVNFYDFTGDGINEIFFKSSTGGSGGIDHLAIISLKDSKKQILFPSNQELRINAKGKFVEGFKAEYTISKGKTFSIDLTKNKDFYIEQNIFDKSGNIINETDLWITDLVTISPEQSEDKYNIKTVQMVKGLSNSDTIGQINAYWEYKNNKWKLIEIETQ